MIRLLGALALSLSATPAFAADRTFSVGSFERLRVDGPFEVRVTTGASPGARASGGRELLDRVDIDVNGTTLVVRMGSGGWGETPAKAGGTPPVITLSTPRLVSATVSAGARVMIGAGVLSVAKADTDQLNATLVGTGQITLGGRASRARLLTNGPGAIDASALTVNDLIVRLEGAGETKASARYTAQVNSTGLGKVTVTGGAKCTIKAVVNGPVVCGGAK
jgi:Putative auto-transporter adhesin, head GIN domain